MEVAALEEALGDNRFPQVTAHLDSALTKLSSRDNPDYRNSIKESISAVESMASIVAGKKATLEDALRKPEGAGRIHPALTKGFQGALRVHWRRRRYSPRLDGPIEPQCR